MNLQNLRILATPFPVLVFDNVFAPSLLRAAYYTWPNKDWANWIRIGQELKRVPYQSNAGRNLPPASLFLMDQMSSFPLEDFLGPLALQKSEFFPDLSYYSDGLRSIGKVNHIPFSYGQEHPLTGWQELVHLVLFITPEWKEEYGGETILHGATKERLSPCFNRLLVYPSAYEPKVSTSLVANTNNCVCSLHTHFWIIPNGE